jgi:hypothetical protein
MPHAVMANISSQGNFNTMEFVYQALAIFSPEAGNGWNE